MTAPDITLSERQPRRWLIPFLETDPLFDVRWGVLLLPLWWALGIEQFIWPVLFGLATIKMLYIQRGQVRTNAPLRWFALFILAILVSAFFIVEPERWLTYWRNFGAFVAGFLVLLIVSNRARRWRDIEQLLDAALLVVLVAGVLGLLAVVGVWRPAFMSFAGRLLPGGVLGTSYGAAIAHRNLGQVSWFAGLGLFFRLNSLFLFSNHYSSVLVYAIPFLFYKLERERGLRRVLVGLGIVMLALNLVYTTGRVALLSLMGGALIFALFYTLRRRAITILVAVGLVLAIWVLALLAAVEYGFVGGETGLVGRAVGVVDAFVFARGAGSYTSRFGVYQATIQGFLERPLFGWGTERDVVGLDLPAGSHSEYFATLYRQGLFGLLTFLGLLAAVWRTTRPIRAAAEPAGTLLRYGRWFFVAALVNSLLNDPNVDSTTYILLWLFVAILVATAQFIRQQTQDDDPAAGH